jgi:hypothetical protein
MQGFCPGCGDYMMTMVPTRVKDTFQCQVCGLVVRMVYRKFTIPANRCKSWRFTGKKRGWCSEHDQTCFGCEKWVTVQ